MKNLTAIIYLTLAVLLGGAGVWWSADYQKGVTAAQEVPEIPKKNSEVAMGECPKGTFRDMQLGTCKPESSSVNITCKHIVVWYGQMPNSNRIASDI